MARLKEQYVNEIAPALNSKFGYKSVMQIPKLDKVVINVACGEAKDNEKILEAVMKDLGQITGQKAVVCRAANTGVSKTPRNRTEPHPRHPRGHRNHPQNTTEQPDNGASHKHTHQNDSLGMDMQRGPLHNGTALAYVQPTPYDANCDQLWKPV